MLYKATTKGGIDGKTAELLGFFHANSKLQVIEHLIVGGANPNQTYQVELVEARDIRKTKVNYVHRISTDAAGNTRVYLQGKLEEELQRRLIYSKAVNKLTEKEKEVLGIPIEHRGVDY